MAITKKAASKKAAKRPYKRRTAVPEKAPTHGVDDLKSVQSIGRKTRPTPLLNFDPNKHVIVDLNDPRKVGELLEKLVDQRMEQRTKQYAHIVEEEERIMRNATRDSAQISVLEDAQRKSIPPPPIKGSETVRTAMVGVIDRQLKSMGHIEISINKLMAVTNRASGSQFDILDTAPHMAVNNRLDNMQTIADILERFGEILEKVTESLDHVI